MTEKPKTDPSRQLNQIMRRNIFKGSLKGYVCEDCREVIADVEILFYLPYKKEIPTNSNTKETFRFVSKEESKEREKLFIGKTMTDKEGNFQFENEKLVLRKVKFWNMPYTDLLEVEKVWTKTQQIVAKGEIVKGFKTDKNGKVSRKTNFPNKEFSKISLVRPHARDASDTYPLPTQDNLTKENEYTKHCFWLNNRYVRDEIYLKK